MQQNSKETKTVRTSGKIRACFLQKENSRYLFYIFFFLKKKLATRALNVL